MDSRTTAHSDDTVPLKRYRGTPVLVNDCSEACAVMATYSHYKRRGVFSPILGLPGTTLPFSVDYPPYPHRTTALHPTDPSGRVQNRPYTTDGQI